MATETTSTGTEFNCEQLLGHPAFSSDLDLESLDQLAAEYASQVLAVTGQLKRMFPDAAMSEIFTELLKISEEVHINMTARFQLTATENLRAKSPFLSFEDHMVKRLESLKRWQQYVVISAPIVGAMGAGLGLFVSGSRELALGLLPVLGTAAGVWLFVDVKQSQRINAQADQLQLAFSKAFTQQLRMQILSRLREHLSAEYLSFERQVELERVAGRLRNDLVTIQQMIMIDYEFLNP